MTKDELKAEYGENNVFDNQFEMAKFAQEFCIRNKVERICERFSNEKVKYNNDILYDLAELLLSKNLAFFNDGCYIIEDLEELKSL